MEETPHYLRFARALALVSALGTTTVGASGCCPVIPDSVACAHCTCAWSGGRTVSQPISCSTIGRDPVCCTPPVVGPLAPPSLSS